MSPEGVPGFRDVERVLILNPAAGGIDDVEAVLDTVRDRGPCRVLRTDEAGDARRFAEAAMVAGARTVVVGGGDGTVREVAHGFLDAASRVGPDAPGSGEYPEMVILPLGTGNDLARCLGIPTDLGAALALVAGAGRTRMIDLMEASLDGVREPAVNAVVLGSGGRIGEVLDPEEKERWGPLSYLRSAAEVMLHLEPLEVEMALDGGGARSLEILNIVIANGCYAARGIPVAPGADPGDGVLEVVTVREAGIPDILALLPVLLHGSHPEHPAWEHRRASQVHVRATGPRQLPVSLDGEHRKARNVRVRILPGRVPIRVPLT